MDYYKKIKEELVNNEIYKTVKDYSKNRSDLQTYYNVGKLLVEAQGGEERAKYGNKLIREYSQKLTNDLGKGYGITNLKNMRSFYLLSIGQSLPDQLSWSHYCELLRIKNKDTINYYIDISIAQNLTYRQLRRKIKSMEYERLPLETKNKLVEKQKIEIHDMVKNPIIIRNKYDISKISEKVLQNLILEDLPLFMEELGEGFCFINSEYKIKIGDRYNYIDLLLFNYIYNAFVVVELKVTELKSEHIGQINKYMNYIDKNIKSINQDKTIGIIICKKENKFVLEYSSDERIISRKYELI